MNKVINIIFILIVSMYVLISCDLVETRNPENPVTARSNFSAATTHSQLFENFKNSLSDKIVENYISCFLDEELQGKKYVYIPSSGSISKYVVLSDWSLQAERQYFNNMISVLETGTAINLDLLNETANIMGDSAKYQYDYILSLKLSDESIPDLYKGSLQFTIEVDNRNQWVITKWEDIKDANQPSWSELKGRLY